MNRAGSVRESWTSRALGADLLVELDGSKRSRARIERAIRHALSDGRLSAGDALPSSRGLARDLGVARGTVVAAYGQLASEGWLSSRPGARTVVAQAGVGLETAPPPQDTKPPAYDFRPGIAAWWSFPRGHWGAAMRKVLRSAPDAAFGYGDAAGDLSLRRALSVHLARARAVAVRPESVLVCGGFRQGLATVCRVLVRRGARRIAVEEPCLPHHRLVCAAAGLEVVPVPCDPSGLQVELLDRSGVDAVLVTPAHHFPLGVALAPDRRAALLEWARRRDALVIEDDYDGEYRYDRQGIGAFQALDPDRVVYGGTASKSLAPGLRLGWIVPPAWLRAEIERERETEERGRPILDQLTLAELLVTTRYDQHIRRMRVQYRERRRALLAALSTGAPQCEVLGLAAGMQVVVTLPRAAPGADEVVRLGLERGVGLSTLGSLYASAHDDAPQGLVINHAGPPPFVFERAVQALATYLGAVTGALQD